MPVYPTILRRYNRSADEAMRNYNRSSNEAMRNYNKQVENAMLKYHSPGLPDYQPIMTSMQFGGFREKGGPVTPGKAYVVGEKRPELFIPDEPGRIVNISRKSIFDAMKR